MKLTVKNIVKVLKNEYSECPMCGDKAEICAYNAEGLQVKIFCNSCGMSADFVEVLVEIEKKTIERSLP